MRNSSSSPLSLHLFSLQSAWRERAFKQHQQTAALTGSCRWEFNLGECVCVNMVKRISNGGKASRKKLLSTDTHTENTHTHSHCWYYSNTWLFLRSERTCGKIQIENIMHVFIHPHTRTNAHTQTHVHARASELCSSTSGRLCPLTGSIALTTQTVKQRNEHVLAQPIRMSWALPTEPAI